jgi:hypothetical protein
MKRLLLLSFLVFTLSTSFAQVLLEEDFENGWPEGFLLINVDGLVPNDPDLVGLADSAWSIRYITQEAYNSNTAFSVSWYLNDEGPSDDWMILPAVTVEANTILSWTAMAITSSGDYRDRYQVAISTEDPEIEDFEANALLFDTGELGEEDAIMERMVNLTEAGYEGETVYIAFRNFTAPYDPDLPIGPGNGGNELMIDNIRIEANVTSVTNVDPGVVALRVFPNPAAQDLQVGFELQEAQEVEIRIYDLSGKLVVHRPLGRLSAGAHLFDQSVADFGQGAYVVNIATETFQTTQTFEKY